MLGKKRIINSDTMVIIRTYVDNVLVNKDTDTILKLEKEAKELLDYNKKQYQELKKSKISNKEEVYNDLRNNIEKLRVMINVLENSSGTGQFKLLIPDFDNDNNTIIK